MILKNSLLVCFCALTFASCADKTPEPIMTDEKFESRILDDGSVEFVFGLSWANTSASSIRSHNRIDDEFSPSRGANREREERQSQWSNRFGVTADNQTKLALEDKAAESLQRRLTKEKLCDDGHQITDVFWQNSDIRLLGRCL